MYVPLWARALEHSGGTREQKIYISTNNMKCRVHKKKNEGKRRTTTGARKQSEGHKTKGNIPPQSVYVCNMCTYFPYSSTGKDRVATMILSPAPLPPVADSCNFPHHQTPAVRVCNPTQNHQDSHNPTQRRHHMPDIQYSANHHSCVKKASQESKVVELPQQDSGTNPTDI